MLNKYLIFSIFSLNLTVFGQSEEFFNTLGQIESGSNPKAYNKKENAVGIYQINYNLLYLIK